MFKDTLCETAGGFGRRAAALPVAVLVHLAIAALLVTVPLVHEPGLPEVDSTAVFLAPAPLRPLSAPPKGKGAKRADSTRIKRMGATKALSPGAMVVPTEIPTGITTEELTGSGFEWGVEGGVPVDDAAAWEETVPGWILEPVIPDDDLPVRAGGEITPPRLVRRVAPDYPEIARAARVSGVVVLEATTDVSGRVVDVTVLRSIPLLDEAAIDAVRRWIYEPMVVSGRPRPVTFTVTVRFELK